LNYPKTEEAVISDVMAINPHAVMILKSTVPVEYTAKLLQQGAIKQQHRRHRQSHLRRQGFGNEN
jgi:hypothetical protein